MRRCGVPVRRRGATKPVPVTMNQQTARMMSNEPLRRSEKFLTDCFVNCQNTLGDMNTFLTAVARLRASRLRASRLPPAPHSSAHRLGPERERRGRPRSAVRQEAEPALLRQRRGIRLPNVRRTN